MSDRDVWTVDRIGSGIAVLVRDDGEQVVEAPLWELPAGTRQGSVLRVPDREGRPAWGAARLDEDLRRRRLDKAERILRRLRRRDPGGDVAL